MLILLLFFIVLMLLDLPDHLPGASRETPACFTGINSKAPYFVLLNQDGNRFDSTTIRGKVVVLNFIFTTCTDVCPLFTANLAQLQRTLKSQQADNLFVVSITTDP